MAMEDTIIHRMNGDDPGPCPFCHSEEVWYEPTHDDGTVWLMCPNCGCDWREET